MNPIRLGVAVLCAAIALAGCTGTPSRSASPQGDAGTVFRQVNLIDGSGTPARTGMGVLIRDGRIVEVAPDADIAVPPGGRVVDLAGRTMMPGMIANHSHLAPAMHLADGRYTDETAQAASILQLQQYQRFGIAAVSILGASGDVQTRLQQAQASGQAGGADILVGSDRGIGVLDGAPPMNIRPDQVYRPATVEAAREAVRESAQRGSRMVKLWIDDFRQVGRELPKMDPAIFAAVIDEAHGLDMRVAAHIYYLDDAKALVRAGADFIAHGVRDQPVDDEFIQLLRERDVGYIATLTVDKAFYAFAEQPALLDDPLLATAVEPAQIEQWRDAEWREQSLSNLSARIWRHGFQVNQHNLKRLSDAGVKLGFGTDSGATPTRIPGYAEHRELLLSVQAGLTPLQAITLATGQAAQLFALEDRGRIEAGRRADLVILEDDPSRDIIALRSIQAVWQAGRPVAGELLP